MNAEEIARRNDAFAVFCQENPIFIASQVDLSQENSCLAIIGMVNGFCTAGAGNLAPPNPDPVIDEAVANVDRLARRFLLKNEESDYRCPIVTFLDCHDGEERPYLIHCQRGTFEAQLVDRLKWLERDADWFIYKSSTNAYFEVADTLYNRFVLGILLGKKKINRLVVAGLCTDICIKQFVQSVLAARNKGLLPSDLEVVVYVPGCTTYDLPLAVCRQRGLPDTKAHARDFTHHMGLYLMQQSGAILANSIKL